MLNEELLSDLLGKYNNLYYDLFEIYYDLNPNKDKDHPVSFLVDWMQILVLYIRDAKV